MDANAQEKHNKNYNIYIYNKNTLKQIHHYVHIQNKNTNEKMEYETYKNEGR